MDRLGHVLGSYGEALFGGGDGDHEEYTMPFVGDTMAMYAMGKETSGKETLLGGQDGGDLLDRKKGFGDKVMSKGAKLLNKGKRMGGKALNRGMSMGGTALHKIKTLGAPGKDKYTMPHVGNAMAMGYLSKDSVGEESDQGRGKNSMSSIGF